MQSYHNVTMFSSDVIEFEPPVKDYGDYVVDDSSFVPMSEAVKRVTAGSLTPDQVKSMFDFKDGVDTGVKIPVDRSHRFSGDIAEVSEFAYQAVADVSSSLAKAKEDYDYQVAAGKIDPSTGAASSSSSEE